MATSGDDAVAIEREGRGKTHFLHRYSKESEDEEMNKTLKGTKKKVNENHSAAAASPLEASRNSLISPATYSSSTSCKPLPKVTGSAPISSRSA